MTNILAHETDFNSRETENHSRETDFSSTENEILSRTTDFSSTEKVMERLKGYL
jgi:hypothetical protein